VALNAPNLFFIPMCFCPSSPNSFSHKRRRKSSGVLMPKTGEGTQGLPKNPSLYALSRAQAKEASDIRTL